VNISVIFIKKSIYFFGDDVEWVPNYVALRVEPVFSTEPRPIGCFITIGEVKRVQYFAIVTPKVKLFSLVLLKQLFRFFQTR
jgi:hypothetical protein